MIARADKGKTTAWKQRNRSNEKKRGSLSAFETEAVLLRAKHILPTPRRVRILRYFFETPLPQPITTIHKKLGRNAIDLATIYRTIELFRENRLIQEIRMYDLPHFELTSANHAHGHHHHITCQLCGAIEDWTHCNIDEKQLPAHTKTFSSIENHTLELLGICNKCSEMP